MKRACFVIPLIVCSGFLFAWRAPSDNLLQELAPDRPESYLEIGERIAAGADNDAQVHLARQVLAIGIGLNYQGGDRVIASSCCIALADTISEDPVSQQLLWDLALTIDPDRLSAWAEHRAPTGSARANALAAECVRLARNASVDEAGDLLKQRAVRDSIEQACVSLGFDPAQIMSELELMLRGPTRDPCRGQVFESIVQDGQSSRVICDAHQYPIATAPNPALLSQLIAIEIFCLQAQGEISDWGGIVAMGLHRTLQDPAVEDAYAQFGVDPQRPYRRNGRWVSQP